MIKVLIPILLIFGILSSVEAKPKKKKVTVSVGDSTMYSKDFINSLKTSQLENVYKSIDLKDSILILDKKDTVYFPLKPEIGRFYILKSQNKMWISELVIERINLTSIEYKVAFTDRLRYRIEEKGIATLNPSFVLGSELDEIDGDAYLVDEYTDTDGKKLISIRLGVRSITDSKLLGRVSINGIDRCSIIELDKLPVYKEESE